MTAEGCVCGLYGPLDCPLSISVVMSRPEARSASNSARLLALWLPGVELHVRGAGGEGPEPASLAARAGSALLFPGSGRAEKLPTGVRHLIVPDGTWAQARRIERRWFAPQGLPRVALWGNWPSVYGLRRGGEGLCTFEAVAIALGLLHDRALAERLLQRFSEWARRAQRLKAGGAPTDLARRPPSTPAPAHPAIDRLRTLSAATSDARPTPDRTAAERAADANAGETHSAPPTTDDAALGRS